MIISSDFSLMLLTSSTMLSQHYAPYSKRHYQGLGIIKVAGVKVYLRQNRNSRAHAVAAGISLRHHGPQWAHTTEIGLMKIKKCPYGTLSKPTVPVTSRANHKHLLHGI